MDYLTQVHDPDRGLLCVELFSGKQTIVDGFRTLTKKSIQGHWPTCVLFAASVFYCVKNSWGGSGNRGYPAQFDCT